MQPPTSVDQFDPLLNNPVENITWEMAMEFCQELTSREKAKGKLPDRTEYRLPTEAEWWALATSPSAALPASADDALGWFLENGKGQHRAVTVQPADDRVYELFGNVAEWCLDAWTDKLPENGASDPLTIDESMKINSSYGTSYLIRKGSDSLRRHVVVGGSFRNPAGHFFRIAGAAKAPDIGFRVVLGYPAGISFR